MTGSIYLAWSLSWFALDREICLCAQGTLEWYLLGEIFEGYTVFPGQLYVRRYFSMYSRYYGVLSMYAIHTVQSSCFLYRPCVWQTPLLICTQILSGRWPVTAAFRPSRYRTYQPRCLILARWLTLSGRSNHPKEITSLCLHYSYTAWSSITNQNYSLQWYQSIENSDNLMFSPSKSNLCGRTPPSHTTTFPAVCEGCRFLATRALLVSHSLCVHNSSNSANVVALIKHPPPTQCRSFSLKQTDLWMIEWIINDTLLP